MLPEVDKVLDELGVLEEVQEKEDEFDDQPAAVAESEKKREEEKEKEKKYDKGGYWDDYCLALFLRGVCMRYVAYPVCFIYLFKCHLSIDG